MEEKNWLKELVESSDFEYFDGENYEDLEDATGRVVAGQGKATPVQGIVAGQGKGTGNNVVYQAVPRRKF